MSEIFDVMVSEISDLIKLLIAEFQSDERLKHLTPLLIEAQRAAEQGGRFSYDDIQRVIELFEASSGKEGLGRVEKYARLSKTNMFARALTVAMEHRKREN